MLTQITRTIRELNRQRLSARRLRKMSPQKDICMVQAGAIEIDVVATFSDRSAISPDAIVLPTSDTPEVSLIISAYGKADYTLRCLRSLMLYPPQAPFEVLVIEDASGDPTAAALRQVHGIRYIENEVNLGYLRSNNKAVKQARAPFVHLLNNDTQVLPGAIDALLNLARTGEHVMVGSKLIYPNGILQEAGGIIWEDGSAWNFGRNDHHAKRLYNYVREVSYCSGASILLRRSTWDAAGGYDEHYLPAYCEDSDLAFKVRQLGGRVLYQPESVIIHDEGVSHGTSTLQGVKRHQVTNTEKLKQRWHAEMAHDSYPSGERFLLRARDRSKHKKLVLVIDHNLPEPDRDAGSRTMMAFVDALQANGCQVKYWSDEPMLKEVYARALQQKGVEAFGSPDLTPFSYWIKVNGPLIDCVLVSRPAIADRYIPMVRQHSKAKVIFYGHDLHHARLHRLAELKDSSSTRIQAEQVRQLEIKAWRQSDVSLYPSEDEANVARAILPGANIQHITPYSLVPVPTERTELTTPTTSQKLLFVAGFNHHPNSDAAIWLVREILPMIRAGNPHAHLYLVGSNPSAEVLALAGQNVTVSGSVSDSELAEHYRQAMVCVVPLRVGAGVKLKTLEAMCHGVPLVTTSVGMQGLPDAQLARVADEPEAFASEVLKLLQSPSERRAARETALRYIREHYSAGAMQAAWATLI